MAATDKPKPKGRLAKGTAKRPDLRDPKGAAKKAVLTKALAVLTPVVLVLGALGLMVVVISALLGANWADHQAQALAAEETGVPVDMFDLYLSAGELHHVDWHILAAIGHIQTESGTDFDGVSRDVSDVVPVVTPPIVKDHEGSTFAGPLLIDTDVLSSDEANEPRLAAMKVSEILADKLADNGWSEDLSFEENRQAFVDSVAALPIMGADPALGNAVYSLAASWKTDCGEIATPGGGPFLPGSGGQAPTVDPTFSLGPEGTPEANQQRRVNLMRTLMDKYELTAEQASGIIGNFWIESGGSQLPPDMNQGGVRGAPSATTRGGNAYGWAQWDGGRKQAFMDLAVDHGYVPNLDSPFTDAANLAYLFHELDNTPEGAVLPLLRQATTPEEAAKVWMDRYERPGRKVLDERQAYALQAYSDFHGGEPPEEGSGAPAVGAENSPGCSPGLGTARSVVLGDVAFPLAPTKSVVLNPGMFNNGTADRGGHPYIAYDILASPDTPVTAFTSGRVVRVSEDRCPGRFISVLDDQSGLVISYLHLAHDRHAQLGDHVEVGEQIGVVGSAAAGCGIPHLHIDAAIPNANGFRVGCSRLHCPPENQARFQDIGPELFATFQALP